MSCLGEDLHSVLGSLESLICVQPQDSNGAAEKVMPVHEHEMLTTVFIKNLPRALSGDRDDKVKEDGFLSHTELSHRGKKGNT